MQNCEIKPYILFKGTQRLLNICHGNVAICRNTEEGPEGESRINVRDATIQHTDCTYVRKCKLFKHNSFNVNKILGFSEKNRIP